MSFFIKKSTKKCLKRIKEKSVKAYFNNYYKIVNYYVIM